MIGENHVWADSEIFPWWGVPDTNNLPADYEIEYIRVWERGPAFLWYEFVEAYSLSGVKTNHTDVDHVNDWSEYIFDGNPTNPADIGKVPVLDAATGEYTYQIRNDTSLIAHVVTTTNLTDSTWSTNATVDVAVNDGLMATNHTILGTSEEQLFVALLIEEDLPPVVYPSSKGNNVSDEWIADVNIGSINRTSGADGGYYDGTAMSTTAAKGGTVSVSLSPGHSGTTYPEVWRVWIDLNHDGDFTDTDEEVFGSGQSQTTVTGSFTLPTTHAYTGPTRMRVSMRWWEAPPSAGNFDYGEVEDYTFIIE